ncbi:GNAT family N-acetyltransferase [Bacillus sp. 03113]|uniref:GNAT family N-acetyltransferase n=1 Tax=Bacillus sp. 03113 TaxID=2578211 RepID=UPI001144FF87|nr:GNAT family N-acetyltransferase [Bacillus sp. 03113]
MKHLLIDFPDKIETERLYIRPCLPGDGNELFHAIEVSREDLKKWLPFVHTKQTIEETEENIRKAHAQFILREDFRLHIYRKKDQKLVGSTGFHRINWEVRKFEIGYWCHSYFQKKGYITETVQALIKFAFDSFQANRIEIRCDPDNTNSRKIPEKLGFTLEGILRKDCLSADGKSLRDTCVFSLVRE